jgi:hypothetical protein
MDIYEGQECGANREIYIMEESRPERQHDQPPIERDGHRRIFPVPLESENFTSCNRNLPVLDMKYIQNEDQ